MKCPYNFQKTSASNFDNFRFFFFITYIWNPVVRFFIPLLIIQVGLSDLQLRSRIHWLWWCSDVPILSMDHRLVRNGYGFIHFLFREDLDAVSEMCFRFWNSMLKLFQFDWDIEHMERILRPKAPSKQSFRTSLVGWTVMPWSALQWYLSQRAWWICGASTCPTWQAPRRGFSLWMAWMMAGPWPASCRIFPKSHSAVGFGDQLGEGSWNPVIRCYVRCIMMPSLWCSWWKHRFLEFGGTQFSHLESNGHWRGTNSDSYLWEQEDDINVGKLERINDSQHIIEGAEFLPHRWAPKRTYVTFLSAILTVSISNHLNQILQMNDFSHQLDDSGEACWLSTCPMEHIIASCPIALVRIHQTCSKHTGRSLKLWDIGWRKSRILQRLPGAFKSLLELQWQSPLKDRWIRLGPTASPSLLTNQETDVGSESRRCYFGLAIFWEPMMLKGTLLGVYENFLADAPFGTCLFLKNWSPGESKGGRKLPKTQWFLHWKIQLKSHRARSFQARLQGRKMASAKPRFRRNANHWCPVRFVNKMKQRMMFIFEYDLQDDVMCVFWRCLFVSSE